MQMQDLNFDLSSLWFNKSCDNNNFSRSERDPKKEFEKNHNSMIERFSDQLYSSDIVNRMLKILNYVYENMNTISEKKYNKINSFLLNYMQGLDFEYFYFCFLSKLFSIKDDLTNEEFYEYADHNFCSDWSKMNECGNLYDNIYYNSPEKSYELEMHII